MRKCAECGKPLAGRPNKLYCSTRCANLKYARDSQAKYQPKEKVSIECRTCSAPFTGHRGYKYCSPACREKARAEQALRAMANHKIRRAIAAEKPVRTMLSPSSEKPGDGYLGIELHPQFQRRGWVRDFYVYGWYHPLQPGLPFYVGQGSGSRAWEVHGEGWSKQFCEMARHPEMRVRVYRDNLTREGALLVESVLVKLLLDMGAPLLNQAEPMRRQETPPLEFEG